jgi:nicotinate-nucleotide adenylyltransferase
LKIGILGGTFNPIHIGHLILAEEVREKLRLDRVIFVPTYIAPHKQNSKVAAAQERLSMVKAAIKGNSFLKASDIEIKRKGPSYTVDTVKAFNRKFPGDELYFIAGSDLLKYLDEWKDFRELLGLVKFVVATRPGYPLENIPAYVQRVGIRAVDVSAFEIRQCIKGHKSFRYLVPEAVFEYINKKKLYL